MNKEIGTPPASLMRRDFLIGSAMLLAAPLVRATGESKETPPQAKTTAIVFQGDSITDAGRSREHEEADEPTGLGPGYVGLIAQALLAEPKNSGLKIFNRGISGNRVLDLLVRWEHDTLALEPDIISILVGVNDTWHRYLPGGVGIKVSRYATFYRMLIEDTLERRPRCQLVLCEPFALPGGQFRDEWMGELRERMAVVRELAREFKAIYVPFQEVFTQELKRRPAADLAADGVHPTPLGHQIMAEAWRGAVGL
jgi:lysophospholipase L1-like esterase